MKSAIKLALFGAVLVGGVANAQTITNTPSTAGGSDLILFAWDPSSTTNTFISSLSMMLLFLQTRDATPLPSPEKHCRSGI